MEYNIGYWVWFLFIDELDAVGAQRAVDRGFGIIGDIVVGIVGAMLGGWIAGVMGLYTSSSVGAFLVALAGAVILVGLTRFVKRVWPHR